MYCSLFINDIDEAQELKRVSHNSYGAATSNLFHVGIYNQICQIIYRSIDISIHVD